MVVTPTDIQNAITQTSDKIYLYAKKISAYFQQTGNVCSDYWDSVFNLITIQDSLSRAVDNLQSGCLTEDQVWDIINWIKAQ